MFVQDTWRPTNQLTIEGGVRWVYWPPFYALENNAASFNPAYYNMANQAVIDRTSGQIVSGPRYNGIVLPGDGFPSSASNLPEYNDPLVNSLFVGVPRGFAETHKNTFEPRLGMSYAVDPKTIVKASGGIFHTPRDFERLYAPRWQRAVPAAGSRSVPARRTRLGSLSAASLTLAMTAIDPVFKHPTAYMWSAGVQREIPLNFILDVTYVGRRGLYLQRERDINQMLAGTIQANPGVEHCGASTVQRLQPNPPVGELGLLEVQQPADQR